MELQQLRYFREVAEREHVTRAAEILFVSQSAISGAVTQFGRGARRSTLLPSRSSGRSVALWALISGARGSSAECA